MDIVDNKTRSRMMAGIRSKDTKPELIVRRALHSQGFRFRLHVKDLPGRPDIVLPRWRAVILVHGCYWHRHVGCRLATTPASNSPFWSKKFSENIIRDERNVFDLIEKNWRVGKVWECGLRGSNIQTTMSEVQNWIYSTEEYFESQRQELLYSDF
jgi:DNA mismatch endonuclease (patch repair protein)